MHLVHIIPRMQLAAVYGAPPVDFLPQQDPVAYEQLVAEAERFVADRFLTLLQGLQPYPVAHIIKVSMLCMLAQPAPENLTESLHQSFPSTSLTTSAWMSRPFRVLVSALCRKSQSEVDTDSIGNVLCKKAQDLKAVAIVMASHSKSSLQQFFLGRCAQSCPQWSCVPLLQSQWMDLHEEHAQAMQSC